MTILVWFFFAEHALEMIPALAKSASSPLPTTVTRFFHLSQIWFYLYFWIATALFALCWRVIDNHPWQLWSVWGSALIIFTSWFNVQVGVAINAWYGPFGDLIQKALTKAGSVPITVFYSQVIAFLGIALVAVVIGVMNSFFISHWVFRWRTAMNNYYMANWQRLRQVEGAAQRVQEDTMRFASTLEGWGSALFRPL